MIQDCLSTVSEADYNQIMLSYKVCESAPPRPHPQPHPSTTSCTLQTSEHADHEYTQIIVLVALLRLHFQRKQEKHTHRGLLPHKSSSFSSLISSRPPAHPQRSVEDTSSKLSVPALTRAKLAIANSFENLRSKPATDRKRKFSQDKMQTKREVDSIRSTSPLFARKTNIATLMAPVTTSPMKVPQKRERSWTADLSKSPQVLCVPANIASESHEGEPGEDSEEHKDKTEQKELFKTPHRVTLPKRRRSLHRSGERSARHSLTPPSVSTADQYLRTRGHRRSSSNVIISRSWRQEIFDSVSTPTKLDGGLHRANSDIRKCTTKTCSSLELFLL